MLKVFRHATGVFSELTSLEYSSGNAGIYTMQAHKLDELILYVEDMAAQAEFYCGMLGLKPKAGKLPGNLPEVPWLPLDAGEFTLALHAGGKGRIGEDSPKFVFVVADLEQARAHLESTGLGLPAIFEAAPGTLVLNLTDPEGNRFSLEQRS